MVLSLLKICALMSIGFICDKPFPVLRKMLLKK